MREVEVDKPVVDVVKVDPPRISVSIGFKMNMGNYESANVNMGITASAFPNEKTAEAVDRVYALAEEKLLEKFGALKAELEEGGLGKD